jgi:glutaredoxin
MAHWLANLLSPRRARKSPTRRSRRQSRPIRSKSVKRGSYKRMSPTRSSPKRSSPKRSSPTRSSPKRSSPTRSSPKRSSPKRMPRTKKTQSSLEHRIRSTDWFIVTTKGCGFCGESKKLLRANGQKYKSRELTEKNEDKIWPVTDKLAKKKYRYFPMIFRKGKFFGGYGELQKKYEKK